MSSVDFGEVFRELNPDELVHITLGHEYSRTGKTWFRVPLSDIGDGKPYKEWQSVGVFVRAPKATQAPKVPKAKKSKTTPTEPGTRNLAMGDTMRKGDQEYRRGKWRPVPKALWGKVIQKVRIPRRRKTAEGHMADLWGFAGTPAMDKGSLEKASQGICGPGPTSANGSQCPEAVGTWERVPGYQDSPIKPFTPNKYTRTLHTLDGRKVPVDVYCVLAAFSTGSAAIDHAVKKLLAPGARGVKSRIQDIKEAHASLGRAIELEEEQGE